MLDWLRKILCEECQETVVIIDEDGRLPPPQYLDEIDYSEVSSILKAEGPNATRITSSRR